MAMIMETMADTGGEAVPGLPIQAFRRVRATSRQSRMRFAPYSR